MNKVKTFQELDLSPNPIITFQKKCLVIFREKLFFEILFPSKYCHKHSDAYFKWKLKDIWLIDKICLRFTGRNYVFDKKHFIYFWQKLLRTFFSKVMMIIGLWILHWVFCSIKKIYKLVVFYNLHSCRDGIKNCTTSIGFFIIPTWTFILHWKTCWKAKVWVIKNWRSQIIDC